MNIAPCCCNWETQTMATKTGRIRIWRLSSYWSSQVPHGLLQITTNSLEEIPVDDYIPIKLIKRKWTGLQDEKEADYLVGSPCYDDIYKPLTSPLHSLEEKPKLRLPATNHTSPFDVHYKDEFCTMRASLSGIAGSKSSFDQCGSSFVKTHQLSSLKGVPKSIQLRILPPTLYPVLSSHCGQECMYDSIPTTSTDHEWPGMLMTYSIIDGSAGKSVGTTGNSKISSNSQPKALSS